MLAVEGIDVFHGTTQALFGVSLTVAAGEVHALVGRNGAGKTTTLRAIMGQLPVRSGTIRLDRTVLSDLPPHRIAGARVGYVPQGRRLFGELTVAQNLRIGLMARGAGDEVRERVLTLFPVLRDRLSQRAGTLSGGEQQQLAIARALCVEPQLLLMDEPSEGLQPSIVRLIRETVGRLRQDGVSILLVEQRVDLVEAVADRVTFLENGRTRETVAAAEVTPERLRRYVGI